MTLAEAKKKWPLGSIVRDNGDYEEYIIGYWKKNEEIVGVGTALIVDNNGSHNFLSFDWFRGESRNEMICLEEGIEKAGIPFNRHGGDLYKFDKIEMVKSKYNWIEL